MRINSFIKGGAYIMTEELNSRLGLDQ